MSAENYRSANKSHDPGWNDPPKISYSPGVAAGSGPTSKLNLNKRIAFPVAKTDTRSNQPAVGDGGTLPQFVTGASGGIASPLPPAPPNRSGPPLPPMATTGTPLRCNKPGTNASEEATLILPSNDEMKDSVKTTLEELLMKTETSRQAEVRKRLDVMLQSWTDGKLSDGLTRKLYQLAQVLNEKKIVEANEIHRSIIVEHGKECVQWAPALRQLIQVVPKQEESSSNVETQEPIVNPL